MATGTAMSSKMGSDILTRWLKGSTTVMGANSAAAQYLAIGTAANNNTGITEPNSTHGYSRQQITMGAVGGATSGPATISGPSAATTFGPCTTSDWGNIQYFGIYDSGTYGGGNLLFWGSLTAAVSIAVNDQFQFAASAITLQAD